MRKILFAASAAVLGLSAAGVQAAPTVDTIDASSGQANTYFVPSDAQKGVSPYYRNAGEDWGWQHNAIGGAITSAALNVSAFDVDYDGVGNLGGGERDEIFAWDSGAWVSLGFLGGSNNAWAFTNFVLGANFYDDIAVGLKVKMDIDSTNNGWLVTLAKSTLTIDGANPGNPQPGVPEPASWALMIAGLGIVGASMRRRKTAVSFA